MQGDPGWEESPDLDTVYFGGGTPSRLEPAALSALLAGLTAERRLSPGAEVTIEANPDDVTPEAAAAWRAAGIARVSLGVQSFAPAVLEWMHRTHTADQARAAVRHPAGRRVRRPFPRPHLRAPGRAGPRLAGRSRPGVRARARSPLLLRADGRDAHPPRPLDRPGPGHRGGRGAVRRGVSPAERRARRARLGALRGVERRPPRAPGTAQQRLLDRRRLPRTRSLRPQQHRRGASVEHPRVCRLGRRHSGGTGTRSPGGNR